MSDTVSSTPATASQPLVTEPLPATTTEANHAQASSGETAPVTTATLPPATSGNNLEVSPETSTYASSNIQVESAESVPPAAVAVTVPDALEVTHVPADDSKSTETSVPTTTAPSAVSPAISSSIVPVDDNKAISVEPAEAQPSHSDTIATATATAAVAAPSEDLSEAAKTASSDLKHQPPGISAPASQVLETPAPKPNVDSVEAAKPSTTGIEPAATSASDANNTNGSISNAIKIVDDGSPEPESPLTKKFSDAEWKALKEFRSNLPGMLADGLPDDPEAAEKPYTMWGVSLDPSGKKDARASVVLMKFLRARHLNPNSARDMLVETLRWRTSFKLDEAMKESYPDEVFGKLGHIYGKDEHGGPVTYNIYGGASDLKAVFSDVPRFLRWRVALMEKSIQQLDFTSTDKMVQVHDYAGVSMSSRDPQSKQASSEATNIFSNHYPEFLRHKFFINVPTLMAWLFWGFKAIIPSETFAKMEVIGSSPHAQLKAMLPYISAEELPKQYGGKAEGF